MKSKKAPQVEVVSIDAIRPYERNPRSHPQEQIDDLAASMVQFGWTTPILVDKKLDVVAGHGRLLAARQLGMTEVQIIRLEDLSDAQIKAYRIVDNRLSDLSAWDDLALDLELADLKMDEFDLGLLGIDDPSPAGGDGKQKAGSKPLSVHRVETSPVNDIFWISITGPLVDQAAALNRLREMFREFPRIDVNLSTVQVPE